MQNLLSKRTIVKSDLSAEEMEQVLQKLGPISLPVKLLWLAGLNQEIKFLLSKVRKGNNGCLEWNAAKDWGGYGIVSMFKIQWRVTRLFYFIFNGTIPSTKMICHTCDNPSCVNPEHLFLGTGKENIQDALTKGRMKGPRGEMNGQHKLKTFDVLTIRKRYRRYDRHGNNMYDIARDYGVNATTIHEIVTRKKWASI